jgi:hypothetical protein
MDQAAIGEFRPALLVERRQRAEGDELQHRAEEVVGIGRAAGNIDDGLARQHFGDADCARWVGPAGGDAAPGRAGADGDDRHGALGGFHEVLLYRAVGHLAVDAAILGRNGAIDHQQVVAEVLLHRGPARFLGLVPRCHAEGLVVVERDHVENQVLERGVMRPEQ